VRRKGGPETLERLIERVYPSKEGYVEVRAHRAFAHAVPENIRRRAMPSRVHRGILHVNAQSTAWAQELQMMAPRILDAMRKADPTLDLRELRFRVGPVEAERAPAPVPVEISSAPVEITPDLAAAIASIRDEEVREAFLGALRAYGDGAATTRRDR